MSIPDCNTENSKVWIFVQGTVRVEKWSDWKKCIWGCIPWLANKRVDPGDSVERKCECLRACQTEMLSHAEAFQHTQYIFFGAQFMESCTFFNDPTSWYCSVSSGWPSSRQPDRYFLNTIQFLKSHCIIFRAIWRNPTNDDTAEKQSKGSRKLLCAHFLYIPCVCCLQATGNGGHSW